MTHTESHALFLADNGPDRWLDAFKAMRWVDEEWKVCGWEWYTDLVNRGPKWLFRDGLGSTGKSRYLTTKCATPSDLDTLAGVCVREMGRHRIYVEPEMQFTDEGVLMDEPAWAVKGMGEHPIRNQYHPTLYHALLAATEAMVAEKNNER